MIDKSAFRSLSYGLYIISSEAAGKRAGCVVNTFQQVTSSPLQASVVMNKENATTGVVRRAGRFTAAPLSQKATMELIGTFGFHCSDDCDKFATCSVDLDEQGLPYVAEQVCARFSVRVEHEIDLGTHVLFAGEVDEAERLCDDEPMTYAYYHEVKGGKTPPKASSYLPADPAGGDSPARAKLSGEDARADCPSSRTYAWRCPVCGHIEYVDRLSDDFVCPVCGVGGALFERVEL